MSETSETPTPPPHQTPKVFKAAAWVAIAAGTVFIVAVIFFTGSPAISSASMPVTAASTTGNTTSTRR